VLLFQHSSRRRVYREVKRRDLREFWQDLAAQLAPGRKATCLITTDEELRLLNRRFRRKDTPTDVLSFPTADGSPGEIAISFDRAAEQAAELGHGVEHELRILMLHGLLHLSGMDHETDAGEMARMEARWRKRLGLPLGLIERTNGRSK